MLLALRLGILLRLPGVVDSAVRRVFAFMPFTPLANITGAPSMTVPLFWNAAGLPIGAMFTGRLGDEATLLRLAGQLESARRGPAAVPRSTLMRRFLDGSRPRLMSIRSRPIVRAPCWTPSSP